MTRPDDGNGTIVNVLLTSFVAATAVQLIHEGTHALVTLLVGAELAQFHLWAVDSQWPDEARFWGEALIAGSAAIVNILCWLVCHFIFRRLTERPLLRLFVFYLGAYSLFIGFGYLLIDPMFAHEDSPGDWARIVMLFGGSWAIRLPIAAVGCAGTIYGYYWMGAAAMQFSWQDDMDRSSRNRLGFVLCILPYVLNNLVFTGLAWWHPVGTAGVVAVLLQYWLGYCGFFWAYMIVFVWSDHPEELRDISRLPGQPRIALAVWLVVVVGLIAFLSRGVSLGWSFGP